MYLLRRKSDGKFWKNRASPKRDYRPGHYEWAETEWTEYPNECRPFKTRDAAMRSRGVGWPGNGFWALHHNKSRSEWRKALRAWQDERVETVPVKVQLTTF